MSIEETRFFDVDTDEEDVHLERDEYERKCYDVNCYICAIQDRASEMVLRQRGWVLTGKGEWCPAH